MICPICPHACELSEEQVGKCQVIVNRNGSPHNIYSNRCSVISVDHIERRPLFHFLPGSKFLSVGFLGCSMRCGFCQSFKVSQSVQAKTESFSPSQIVDLATKRDTVGIAFTYNEPTLYYDYIADVGEISDFVIVVKTNGFATDYVWSDLAPHVSAYNVDIKGDDKEYESVCGARLQPVLDSIAYLSETNVHLEISYLVLPRLVDDYDFHRKIALWIAQVDRDIPVHVLYMYPFYQMKASYEPSRVIAVYNIFREFMKYVYISNLHGHEFIGYRNTHCFFCGNLMINRESSTKVHRWSCCGKTLAGKI